MRDNTIKIGLGLINKNLYVYIIKKSHEQQVEFKKGQCIA